MKVTKVLLGLALMAIGTLALAGEAGGGEGGLPWEGGLTSIVDSFTGPVAYAISVLGIIIGIGILIFGNDLNAFGRTIVFLVLAASVIVTAANTLETFTGVGASTTAQTLGVLTAFLATAGAITSVQLAIMRLFKKNKPMDDMELAAA